MNTQSISQIPARTVRQSLTWIRLALLMVMVAIPLAMTSGASAQGVLQRIVVDAPEGVVSIEGEGFSPGGLVMILVSDGQGESLHDPLWIEANPIVHGTNGSQDPAQGYAEAGTIKEDVALGSIESTVVVVRAFDVQSETWSIISGSTDGVDLAPTAEPAPSCTALNLCESPF